MGGLNLINIRMWNKIAIAKTTWDLAHKQDKLWIRWIHTYYIKANIIESAPIPAQESWMIRKIIATRNTLEHTQTMHLRTVSIKVIYQKLLGDNLRVNWKCLMFTNNARPRARFTMWLQLQNILQTTDRLQAWGMDMDQSCKLCKQQLESRDHIYVQCLFTQQVWERIMKWLTWQWNSTTTWDDHLTWCIIRAKGKSLNAQIFKMVYAELVNGIWIERKRRIFENKGRQSEEITKEIAFTYNVRAPLRIKAKLQQLLF
ncbi:hypothetical protein KY289_017035 [Solanum tuberosum]|nr:hypothetical protein KY284_016830 [Solanum tuberosum]KAH0689677.1 hypothetical protein KY289_017035 [Solanum tuberosum]